MVDTIFSGLSFWSAYRMNENKEIIKDNKKWISWQKMMEEHIEKDLAEAKEEIRADERKKQQKCEWHITKDCNNEGKGICLNCFEMLMYEKEVEMRNKCKKEFEKILEKREGCK